MPVIPAHRVQRPRIPGTKWLAESLSFQFNKRLMEK